MRRKGQPQEFTIMIVPHSEGAVFSLKIPLAVVQIVGVVLVTFCLSLLVLANQYVAMAANMGELAELRYINQQQRVEIRYLSAEASTYRGELQRLLELDQQIRELMDLDPSQVSVQSLLASAHEQIDSSPDGVVIASLVGLNTGIVDSSSAEQEVSHFPLDTAEHTRREFEVIAEEIELRTASLASLREDIAEQQALDAATPSIWPASGWITSRYGWRTGYNGYWEFHHGVDVAARLGSPVVATADGKVVFVGWKGAYGKTVEIDHGYGYHTLYGHNSKLVVAVGQVVKRGQIIAYIGSSGQSTGPHVHYEVRRYGQRQNPISYLGN